VSALRQLLGALWVAGWLRARLVGPRLRRVFGRRTTPDHGPDFYLLGADVLAAEGAREPITLSAELETRLELSRIELLDHARSGAARQARSPGNRRRRTVSLTVAALLGLGVLGAGASAVVSGSTGVAAIDRLLGIYEQGLDEPGAAGRPGPSGSDLQPGPSKATEPIEVTLSNGSRVLVSFYLARDGQICSATADADGQKPTGTSGCEPSRVLEERLMSDDGFVPAVNSQGDDVIVKGYLSSRVVDLRVEGPSGPLDVYLGEAWTPDLPDATPLRPFVAVGPLASGGATDSVPRTLDLQNYVFRAVTKDGDRIYITP
jgi:hypothetical protein